MEAIRKTLSQKVRSFRELKNLTQEQLGEKAGLSGKFIGEIERGNGNPTVETLDKIAKALDTPLAQLLTEREEDEMLTRLSKQDIQIISKALEILGRLFGEKKS